MGSIALSHIERGQLLYIMQTFTKTVVKEKQNVWTGTAGTMFCVKGGHHARELSNICETVPLSTQQKSTLQTTYRIG